MATQVLNESQMQIVKMFSFAKTKAAADRLKKTLAKYYAAEAERELDELWASGKMTIEKNRAIAKAHDRIPY